MKKTRSNKNLEPRSDSFGSEKALEQKIARQMKIPSSHMLEPAKSHQLESLVLWRCVGCGAMGNNQPCSGACTYRQLAVVSADEYAELLESLFAIKDQAERLYAVVRKIAGLRDVQDSFEPAYARLQRLARECLRSPDHNETFWRKPVDAEFEPATVWLCATCGQVEAPQSCLGICIRRDGEFLRADHYVDLAAQIETMQRRAHDLTTLVRQLARVAPHAGQFEKTCRVFQEKAIKLLDFAPPAKQVSL
jgi:hypothetical protein